MKAPTYKLAKLIREAKEACKFRGHTMKRFTHEVPYNGVLCGMAYSECKVCGKQVVCEARPEPNGIEIGGEAVALGCND